ncbi:MAG: DUF1415 family protein [Sandaracinaceae bacterium]
MDEALEREARRVYLRYSIEVVEGLGFCPYAERARLDGHTAELVVPEAVPTDEQVGARVEELADMRSLEVGVVILPRLELGAVGLGRWVEVLRKQHAARRSGHAVVAIEGFHPAGALDASSPERLTAFVRRSPDPTLQVTRLSALERVRRGTPTGTAFVDPALLDLRALEAPRRPLHERIGELNLETVQRVGPPHVEAMFEAILRDRDAAYGAIDPSVVRRAST